MNDVNNNRIYVLDDDPINVKTLCDFIRGLGYDARGFTTSGELLAEPEAKKRGRSLFLLSVNSPAAENIRKLREIHGRFPDSPIVLMTSLGATVPHNDAVRNNVHAYLRKPVRLRELELLVLRLTE